MLITLDSSVIVASVMEKEEHHDACAKLMNKLSKAEYDAAVPYSVLVEVTASVKRRTDSEELATIIENDLKNISSINFFELSEWRTEEAVVIAAKTGLRGMDAIIVQIAKEHDASLVTLDNEIVQRAQSIVNIIKIEDILSKERNGEDE
ncbi:MAG: type II toxin-antitoxin system VapC family toxin [Candidatus Aenigmarchaeota archaeon]|nr:type II toxin-antitoxin system VapC family toxin [Candidatus Aenigmarchaeota archaeon]